MVNGAQDGTGQQPPSQALQRQNQRVAHTYHSWFHESGCPGTVLVREFSRLEDLRCCCTATDRITGSALWTSASEIWKCYNVVVNALGRYRPLHCDVGYVYI